MIPASVSTPFWDQSLPQVGPNGSWHYEWEKSPCVDRLNWTQLEGSEALSLRGQRFPAEAQDAIMNKNLIFYFPMLTRHYGACQKLIFLTSGI